MIPSQLRHDASGTSPGWCARWTSMTRPARRFALDIRLARELGVGDENAQTQASSREGWAGRRYAVFAQSRRFYPRTFQRGEENCPDPAGEARRRGPRTPSTGRIAAPPAPRSAPLCPIRLITGDLQVSISARGILGGDADLDDHRPHRRRRSWARHGGLMDQEISGAPSRTSGRPLPSPCSAAHGDAPSVDES